jgi:hypothetical protein
MRHRICFHAPPGSLGLALVLTLGVLTLGVSCKLDERAPGVGPDAIADGMGGGAGSSESGGSAAGGSDSAGNGGTDPGLGGADAGGSAGAGGSSEPPLTAGAFVESGAWHGYAWTSVDAQALGTLSLVDFSGSAATTPFCFAGTISADPPSSPGAADGSQGFAALGFNLNQSAVAAGAEPGPALELVPTATGITLTVAPNAPPAGSTLASAPIWRLQLQDAAGQSWCVPIEQFGTPLFVRFEPDPFDLTVPHFRTDCSGVSAGSPYAREPIASVALVVLGGDSVDYSFDACVSAPSAAGEEASGTLDTQFAKAKVYVNGESYIVYNNAGGVTSTADSQWLEYANNGFEIIEQSADPTPDGSPISFPSIYIGANGLQSGFNGATTSDTDNLPIRVGAITSIPTRFRHNAEVGDYNATYEAWFSPAAPGGEYNSAQSAYLMVWTYKPLNREPIGTRSVTVSIGGRAWGLYVGPRGGSGPDANVPVISYINEGQSLLDISVDFNLFIVDAVGRNLGLTANQFLTDIFAGFEIWDEGEAVQLREFTAVVN